jgi:poly(glycerol-phosphate) alpha-glucosyltransferase
VPSPNDPRLALPDARYFSLTWGIPDDFAGMTTAFLTRNRAFERLAGRSVDIVTFELRPDYPAVQAGLRERGLLSDSAGIINLWDWFRDFPQPPARAVTARRVFSPLDPALPYETTERDGVVLARTRRNDAGEVMQTDHYRGDGTLFASDRRDTEQRGTLGGRSIVLCDETGDPARTWSSPAAFYRYWLDLLLGSSGSSGSSGNSSDSAADPTVLIVDSKTVANFMVGYHRAGVTTVHVLHGSHLDDRGRELRRSRRRVFPRLGEFDLVVTLTETQKRDIAARLPEARNLVCIPNSVEPPSQPHDLARPRTTVAVLASLLPIKRVGDAIEAVARVRAATDAPVQLAVYGEGPQRDALEARIARLDAADCVTLAGHLPDAKQVLAETSMLLLTSRSEGFGLVLLEAMAEGCVPIAYDVPFGPADVIRDGENGFLVPDGDVATLADRVREVLAMDACRLERLRADGRDTVVAYSDEAVTALWARALAVVTSPQHRLRRSLHRLWAGALRRAQRVTRKVPRAPFSASDMTWVTKG